MKRVNKIRKAILDQVLCGDAFPHSAAPTFDDSDDLFQQLEGSRIRQCLLRRSCVRELVNLALGDGDTRKAGDQK